MLIYLDDSDSKNTKSLYLSFPDSESEIQSENNDFSDSDEENESISDIELSNEVKSTNQIESTNQTPSTNRIESTDPLQFNYPQARKELQEKLLNGYTYPKSLASTWRNTHTLTLSEKWSLTHYISWKSQMEL